ncbi:MAG TPA: 4'-phosphopantetheinyl transferase superfamily protein [Myxococcota bacterium]|nr:4'-phosphopantetheinyl transferase superfamily protein [Myxococcota bacterium]
MLGTDVVDLADPESAEAALHPRFDARAFAPAERARLAGSPERARLRWVLWAAKEAAWKAACADGLAAPFHPAAIETRLARAGARFEGEVGVSGVGYRVRVELAGGAVHAVARAAALAPERVVASLERLAAHLPAAQSAGARALALELASRALGAARERLRIARAGRRPQLLCDGAPAGAVLSLAHHGRFAAAALAVGERAAGPRAGLR